MNAISLADDLAPKSLTQLGLETTAIFLDLDGTLAPISDKPGDVEPDRSRNDLLSRLSAKVSGRTAIISGRAIEDVDRILDRRITPVAGVHGLQRRNSAGDILSAEPHPKLNDVRAAFHGLAAAARGLLVEDKGLSVALHYRQAPTCAEPVRDLAHRLRQATGLTLQEGDMVAELRTPGPGKGDALADFMAEAPFEGALPIYIGDDLTDEDAFAAAAAAGGHGILVGARRETCATWRLGGVDDVLAWLAEGLRR